MWDVANATATEARIVGGRMVIPQAASGWEYIMTVSTVPKNFKLTYEKDSGTSAVYFRTSADMTDYMKIEIAQDSLILIKCEDGTPAEVLDLPLDGDWHTAAEVTLGVRDDYVKLWIDDEFCFGWKMGETEVAGAGYIGFGSTTTGDVYIDDVRIAELTNIVDFTSMSTGETPYEVIRRAISQKHVQMWVRPDGSLRAVRPQDNLTSTFTYDHPENISRARDQSDAFSHVRVVGAWEWADYIDDTLLAALGHVFRKFDNSDLMSQGECLEECEYLINEVKARMKQVSFSSEAMVLQEREDRVTVQHEDIGADYRVSSFQMAFEAAEFYSQIVARKYL